MVFWYYSTKKTKEALIDVLTLYSQEGRTSHPLGLDVVIEMIKEAIC